MGGGKSSSCQQFRLRVPELTVRLPILVQNADSDHIAFFFGLHR